MRCFTLPLLTLSVFAGRSVADPDVYAKGVRSTVLFLHRDGERVSVGTGVVVDAKRKLVLTNSHVVDRRETATVIFPEFSGGEPIHESAHYFKDLARRAVRGTVVRDDPKRDLALVRLESLPGGLPAAEWGPRGPRPGETLHAIGNSGAFEGALWRYIRGEVRQVSERQLKFPGGRTVSARVVETQIPINPGDSGGPVFNGRGQLVALSQGARTDADLVRYAIDLREIRTFLADYDQGKASPRMPLVTPPDQGLSNRGLALDRSHAGTWIARGVPAAGEALDWSLRFAPGSIVAATSRGVASARFDGSRLELELDGEPVFAGNVRWLGPTVFLVQSDGGATISFHRE
jgi:hypothetical protein